MKVKALMPHGAGGLSGYMSDLPEPVQNRLKAFKSLAPRRETLRDLFEADLQKYQEEHRAKFGKGLPDKLVSPPPRPEPSELESMSLPIWEHPPVREHGLVVHPEKPDAVHPPPRRQKAAYFHMRDQRPHLSEGRRHVDPHRGRFEFPARIFI